MLVLHEMIIHHAILQGCNCFLAYEIAQYLVGVWKGSGRTFARNHVAILLEEGSGVFGVLAEILLEAWIAGSLLSLQDACACQNHRSSADGTNSLASLVLCDECLAHTLVLVQVSTAWHSAREKQHVCILKAGYILKLQVCLQGDAMCGFHPFTTRNAHGFYLNTTSAEDVNRSQSFDFLEAISKKFIYLCHNFYFFVVLFD